MNECHLKRDHVQNGNNTLNPTINFQGIAVGFSGGYESGKVSEQWEKTGCLGFIGDEILPSYVGIIS